MRKMGCNATLVPVVRIFYQLGLKILLIVCMWFYSLPNKRISRAKDGFLHDVHMLTNPQKLVR